VPRKTVPTSSKAPSTSDAHGAATAPAPTRRTARTKEPTRRAAHPRSADGAHDEASDEHEVVEAEPVEAGDEDREGAYLSEVQRHPLLTPDEEHDLAVRYARRATSKPRRAW
jgi:DNA-directed RNA polymerase sigma subunit (sigma70/sigma32)